MKVFVAVDIGCIECGEPSKILGVFTDPKEAYFAAEAAEEEQKKNWTGEHRFLIGVAYVDNKGINENA